MRDVGRSVERRKRVASDDAKRTGVAKGGPFNAASDANVSRGHVDTALLL